MSASDVEIEIIEEFIIASKQERIIWELNNPRKRSEVVFRRLHDYTILKSECLEPMQYVSASELEKHLFKLSGAKEVYYMGSHYIGNLSLKEAAERADMCDICIIYCGNGIGYYQGEQYYGGAKRFIMVSLNHRHRRTGDKHICGF